MINNSRSIIYIKYEWHFTLGCSMLPVWIKVAGRLLYFCSVMEDKMFLFQGALSNKFSYNTDLSFLLKNSSIFLSILWSGLPETFLPEINYFIIMRWIMKKSKTSLSNALALDRYIQLFQKYKEESCVNPC